MSRVLLRSRGPEETKRIGYLLGRLLGKGSVVCMFGEVGAGKTTMIKGIASSAGINERDITSASFTIMAEYASEPPFLHIDLYRLRTGEEVYDAGVYDAIGRDNIAVVEWSERLPEMPEGALRVEISIRSDTERDIIIEGLHEKDRHHLQTGKA